MNVGSRYCLRREYTHASSNIISLKQSRLAIATHIYGVVDNGGEPGERVSVKTSGRVLVRFADNETLGATEVGTPVYVSSVLGHATMSDLGLTFSSCIGVLEDGSEYGGVPGLPNYNPVAYVYLKNICAGRQ